MKNPISIVKLQDCMEGMKEFPDKYFELAIIDPPYGISINMNMGRKKGQPKKHEQKTWDEYTPDQSYFDELFRVSKNQIIWGGNYFTLPPTRHFIFWDKENAEGMSFSDGEYAWTSFNRANRKYRFRNVTGDKIHPTQKPVQLYKWLLRNYAESGDKILDSFLGSGSSRIACWDGGFDFYGFELDEDYYKAAEQRFQIHISQQRLF